MVLKVLQLFGSSSSAERLPCFYFSCIICSWPEVASPQPASPAACSPKSSSRFDLPGAPPWVPQLEPLPWGCLWELLWIARETDWPPSGLMTVWRKKKKKRKRWGAAEITVNVVCSCQIWVVGWENEGEGGAKPRSSREKNQKLHKEKKMGRKSKPCPLWHWKGGTCN